MRSLTRMKKEEKKMLRLDQRGIAVVAVVVIIVASTGVSVATPVVVDAIDVDPDHPLYGLERLGERIRMVGDEDQMKERCVEAYRMYGKGLVEKYKDIFEEFMSKAEVHVKKPDIKAWMQEHSTEVGVVVDVCDVKPDHILYEFELMGEQTRGVEDKDKIKERLGEFMAMCKKGYGKNYAGVMEKFREKWKELVVEASVDDANRKELLEWMKDQKGKLTEIQIELTQELLDEFKKDKIPPEIAELIKEKKERFTALADKIRATENEEEREAALRELNKAILEQIERFKEKAPYILDAVEKCLHVCKISYGVNVEVKIEIEVGVEIDVKAEFDAKSASLDDLYEQYKAEMPEKVKEIIENLREAAVEAGKTKAGLTSLEKLEDELEAWRKIGEASYREYKENYERYEENIKRLQAIPECPEAIKLKIELLMKAIEEGGYEEAKATLEDLMSEVIEWTPPSEVTVEIPPKWYPRPIVDLEVTLHADSDDIEIRHMGGDSLSLENLQILVEDVEFKGATGPFKVGESVTLKNPTVDLKEGSVYTVVIVHKPTETVIFSARLTCRSESLSKLM
ncbi:MAG: hypothetical protein QMD00_01710 [Hadesarchaea archaeon]|nr:hypothetical protein [Hadesarchaea archaeon]